MLTAMIALVVLIVLVALGVASFLGLTPDTRDPGYGLGQLIRGHGRRASDQRPDVRP